METDTLVQEQEIARNLEVLSRDLLSLIRAVRVYPVGHRFIQDLAERMRSVVSPMLPRPLTIGVTSKDLAVGSGFVGGKDTRASELAGFLHGRRVLRVTWNNDAPASDVIGFADALGDPKAQGADLQAALRRRGIHGIDVAPLDLERIHDLFRETARKSSEDAKSRGQEAWLWLLSDEVSPGQIAEILSADICWGSGEGGEVVDAVELTGILARLGDRLGVALDCLPQDQRRMVQDRLARAGRQVSPPALAQILRSADAAGILQGPLGDALEETFGGDKLVDLLAGLVAQEGRSTRRLAEVYGRFGRGKTDELIPAVRGRLTAADMGGFTVEVWEAVEEFLLQRQEDPYMDAEYSASLESLAAETASLPRIGEELDFTEDLAEHLDRLYVGLALYDSTAWAKDLLDRLETRLEELEPRALLDRLRDVDRGAEALLNSRPALVESAFRLCLGRLRDLDAGGRQALLTFARDHEEVLLETSLRSLGEEQNIATRKFLVEVVAGFSPSATPALVRRIRSAPWYVSRNLTIALGKRREAVAVPVFRSLLNHEHAKVRKEAILALGQVDSPGGRESLADVATRSSSTPEDRDLAERVLRALRAEASRP